MKSTADNGMLEGTMIDELGRKEQVDLLNTIDKLRDLGISDHVGLPQLIVCGDQSSGKSSVLEAITRLRFPTGSDVCTMFATELTLRRATSTHVNVSIKPGSARSESQKKRLAEFNESLTTPEKFPGIIDAAKEHMHNVSEESVHSFFNDILRVEITGPDVLQLTIVDLPGLIHVPEEEKSNDDAVVQHLVESYMANKRSIILAVISASANMSLQKVISLMRQHDPDRARTLGIITKLDTLDDGSEVQQRYLKLAKNQDIVLKHRWHALRNRDFPSRNSSAKERDDVERAFFDNAVWKPLSRTDVGIDALRRKLSTVLLQQIRCELPSLIVGIGSQIDECKSELHQLGEPRPDIGDQKIYLTSICEAYQKIATFAVSGLYECDPFFRDSSPDDKSRKNLRASLQLFNEQFSDVMYNKGHAWELPKYEQQTAAPGYPNPLNETIAQPPEHTNLKFVEDMRDTMLLERRCEPIGMIHPSHVGTLLQNHSKPWRGIAEKHLSRTWEAVKIFLESVISHLTDTTTCAALMAEKIYPMLDDKWDELTTKLEELLFPTRCHPLTYAPEYIDFVCPKPAVNSENQVEGKLADHTGSAQNAHQVYLAGNRDYNYLYMYQVMIKQYNTIRSHFIDNVACLAIEKCLISPLPQMLSAEVILRMDDESVRRLASESTEITDKRDSLQQTLDVLTRGLNTIRRQASLEPEAMRILHKSSSHQNAAPSNATQPPSVPAATQPTPSTFVFNGSRNNAPTNSTSRQNGEATGAPSAPFSNSSSHARYARSPNSTSSKGLFNNFGRANYAHDEEL